jgi:hypothetical protein
MSNSFPIQDDPSSRLTINKNELISNSEIFSNKPIQCNKLVVLDSSIMHKPTIVNSTNTIYSSISTTLRDELELTSINVYKYIVTNSGDDHIIAVDTSDVSITNTIQICLPSTDNKINQGRSLCIVDQGGNAINNNIIITPINTNQKIKGDNGFKLNNAYNSLCVFSMVPSTGRDNITNTNWFII